MSSLFGHATAGAAVYFAWGKLNPVPASSTPAAPTQRWPLWLLMAAAVLPDLDHLAIWSGRMSPAFRPSHSVLMFTLVGVLAWLAARRWGQAQHNTTLPLKACLLAAFSHLILDNLTGLHSDPLLWPLSDTTYHGHLGLLPAAGRMNPLNYYFWRNLVLELGILVPFLSTWVWWQRGRLQEVCSRHPWALAALGLLFTACLLISVQLKR